MTGTMVVVLAEAAITWTPVTYYVAAGILSCILILLAFRVLQVDPEFNTFVGAAIAAVLMSVAGYFFRDMGLVGIIVSGIAVLGGVAMASSGDMVKSLIVFGLILALYAGMGTWLVPRTRTLSVDQVGGLTRVILGGGLEAEPITEKEADKMLDSRGNKVQP